MRRAVVISGGGAEGAFAAGFLEEKIHRQDYSWDEYYGTSTGALVATLASAEAFYPGLLRKGFTTMSDKDVWSKNPINKKGNVKKGNLVRKFVCDKNALGSTKKLRETLGKLYTNEMYDKILSKGVDVISCSTDYTNGNLVYGRNDKLSYNGFLDHVWSSTCVPVLCEGVKVKESLLQDGGVLMNIPIQRAIANGCDEIDIIILATKGEHPKKWNGRGIPDVIGRTIELMMHTITDYAILVPTLQAKEKKVKLRFRYLPHPLAEHPIDVMRFDPKVMSGWFDIGAAHARRENTSMKFVL